MAKLISITWVVSCPFDGQRRKISRRLIDSLFPPFFCLDEHSSTFWAFNSESTNGTRTLEEKCQVFSRNCSQKLRRFSLFLLQRRSSTSFYDSGPQPKAAAANWGSANFLPMTDFFPSNHRRWKTVYWHTLCKRHYYCEKETFVAIKKKEIIISRRAVAFEKVSFVLCSSFFSPARSWYLSSRCLSQAKPRVTSSFLNPPRDGGGADKVEIKKLANVAEQKYIKGLFFFSRVFKGLLGKTLHFRV